MNIRFEINKLGNEDVIATSAALTATPTCYKFIDTNANETLEAGDIAAVYYDGNLLTSSSPIDAYLFQIMNERIENAGITLNFDKFYRVYTDENGKEYLYECKDTTHAHE